MAMGRKRRRKRYRQIDRERFQLEYGYPGCSYPDHDFGRLIARRLKDTPVADDLWLRHLEEQWLDVIGGQIAGHARPGPMQGATLTIYVTSSAWLSELSRFGKTRLLANLQKKFGRDRIRSVRIQLDPDLGLQRPRRGFK